MPELLFFKLYHRCIPGRLASLQVCNPVYLVLVPSQDKLGGLRQEGRITGGMMEVKALIVQVRWHPAGLSVHLPLLSFPHLFNWEWWQTYLISDIHLVSEHGRRLLRSSTDRTLTVPRTHNRFGDRSFAVAGPCLWNSLPLRLRKISSYGQFRRYVKNHLFGIWEITAQCDAWYPALYKYSYLLTYLDHLPLWMGECLF